MNEQQAFHAWLISDENKHGCWGLSGLEIDQMLVAWRARAKLGAGLPPKRIKLEHLMNELTDEQIEALWQEHTSTAWGKTLISPQVFARLVIQKDRAQRPAETYDQTALELCSVCGWKTLIPGDGCLNCERDQRQAEPDLTIAYMSGVEDGKTRRQAGQEVTLCQSRMCPAWEGDQRRWSAWADLPG